MKDQLVFDTTDANTIADSDSVGAYLRSSDGTRLTHTNDGSRDALDVYTELGKAEDTAHVSGDIGAMALAVRQDTAGTLADTDGDYAPLQVDATGALRVNASVNVDSNSEKDEDSAHSSGDTGEFVLAVRQDTLAASTSADGDYAAFKVDAVGSLYVKATDTDALLTTIDGVLDNIYTEQLDQGTTLDAIAVDIAAIETELLDQGTTLDTIAGDTTSIDATLTALSKAEDSVHSSGDQGIMSLAVRNDAGSALAADGDYIPLSTDASGNLRVAVGSIDDAALANTAIANAANSLDVANTAEDIIASPLANRKYVWVYNNGNRRAFIGASGVTSANGFPLAPRSYMEMRAGASVDIEWVSANTSQEIRTLELS